MNQAGSTQPPIVAALGGKQGVIDGAIPPIVFVSVNAVAGLLHASRPLTWAVASSLAIGLGTVAVRRARSASARGAIRGLAGLGIALAFAAVTGQARDFFLPGIAVDAVYGLVFVASALVGRPLIGYIHEAVFRADKGLKERARMRRVFMLATMGWAAVFAVRSLVQLYLYLADQPELLGLAKVALGWPLTALALALTLTAVRRAAAHHCPA